MDRGCCQKVVRYADLAETFQSAGGLSDGCPGFMIGLDARRPGPSSTACAPWRRSTDHGALVHHHRAQSFGVAGVVHQPADRFSMRYAWPSAYWGSLPLEGGIEAAYRADIGCGR